MDSYDLFLFDFDGLLVNTEELHYRAYKSALKKRGIELPWDFKRYCTMAHYGADLFSKALYREIPRFKAAAPSWDEFYQEKKREVTALFQQEKVGLMPGTSELLDYLKMKNKNMCVVTHSPKILVEEMKKQHKILANIPFWITREDYKEPKPDPEGFLHAIEKYGRGAKNIIGFEDTPRGITALLGTPAKPVLVTSIPYPEIPSYKDAGVEHFSSFLQLLKQAAI